jgi:hypothetical protein
MMNLGKTPAVTGASALHMVLAVLTAGWIARTTGVTRAHPFRPNPGHYGLVISLSINYAAPYGVRCRRGVSGNGRSH